MPVVLSVLYVYLVSPRPKSSSLPAKCSQPLKPKTLVWPQYLRKQYSGLCASAGLVDYVSDPGTTALDRSLKLAKEIASNGSIPPC